MALTVHYCARDSNGRLIVKTRLLAFRVIHGSHDGDHLGDIIYSIWKEAGILHLVSIGTNWHEHMSYFWDSSLASSRSTMRPTTVPQWRAFNISSKMMVFSTTRMETASGMLISYF
jgi:hypothetical protein